ncbi:hypothetical protein Btru_048284 [Bulinus truncatus]|nr:hypothetical protein Btru_048284 [Bulinus truncatus]
MATAATDNPELNTKMRILLVGRSGNGMDSCAKTMENTIPTKHMIIAEKCSGIGDTGEDLLQDMKTVIGNVFMKVKDSPVLGTIAAIVLVLKYGVRFTKQEKDAVEVVRLMFGYDVLSKYGVLLFTHGDTFNTDNEDNNRTFIDWCRDQTGDIQSLFEEVDYRIVLFDNKTKDISRLEDQYNTLCDTVSVMNVVYGMEEFDKAKSGRDKLTRRFTESSGRAVTENTDNESLSDRITISSRLLSRTIVVAWFTILCSNTNGLAEILQIICYGLAEILQIICYGLAEILQIICLEEFDKAKSGRDKLTRRFTESSGRAVTENTDNESLSDRITISSRLLSRTIVVAWFTI